MYNYALRRTFFVNQFNLKIIEKYIMCVMQKFTCLQRHLSYCISVNPFNETSHFICLPIIF